MYHPPNLSFGPAKIHNLFKNPSFSKYKFSFSTSFVGFLAPNVLLTEFYSLTFPDSTFAPIFLNKKNT